jgi:glyoxylase-like metal-dependent hydrolase (beta-lactamase superfamily II)
MKRILCLVSVVLLGALSISVAAFQQQPAPQPSVENLTVDKVKDNLFVIKGGGGNTAVFVREKDVVVVDTKNPGWGKPLLEKIKGLTDKPITTVINTHTHGDHVSGNVDFPATVDIVVHENTKANMEKMTPATGITPAPDAPKNIFKENGGKGMPKHTFQAKYQIGSGPDRIDLYYFGRGHTNGDTWVVFPSLHVMHAGDIFSGKNIPLLDANNGGSGVEIGRTLTQATNSIKMVDTIITGHAAQTMTMADLREYAQFNAQFATAVKNGKLAKKSVDEIASSWTIPERYKGYATPAPDRLKNNIQIVYDELK